VAWRTSFHLAELHAAGDEAERQALLRGEPELFFSTPSYEGLPLVMVRLDRVDVARLTELVTDAWRMRLER
jgi:hypothetical protein